MGNSMGLILEARSSPSSFLLPSGSVAYGKAVMNIPHCLLMLFVEALWDPSQMPCQDGPDSKLSVQVMIYLSIESSTEVVASATIPLKTTI